MGGQGGPAALAGDLGRRAAEVEVDVVDARPRRPAGATAAPMTAGSTPQSCTLRTGSSAAKAAMVIVLALPSTRARAVIISLTVEPGAERAAEPAEGDVGDPGHGGEHHRRVHGQRPQLEGGGRSGAEAPSRRRHGRAGAHRS